MSRRWRQIGDYVDRDKIGRDSVGRDSYHTHVGGDLYQNSNNVENNHQIIHNHYHEPLKPHYPPVPRINSSPTLIVSLFLVALALLWFIWNYETPALVSRYANAPSLSASVSPFSEIGILDTITVTNQLVLPVEIKVNGVYYASLAANSYFNLTPENQETTIEFELIRQNNINTGEIIGDEIRGVFYNVVVGSNVYINNYVDEQWYFYPIISNNNSIDCNIIINEGLADQRLLPFIISQNSQHVELGYYKFYKNSNVFLGCGNTTTRFLIHPDYGNMDNYSGVARLTAQ
jgi:hypothetical protein